MNMINRNSAEALIPEQVSKTIIQNVATRSVALRRGYRMPNMTAKQQKIPVLTGSVAAGFVNGDVGLKPTSGLTWEKVNIVAEEVAVIVPIPDAVLDDADYDIWGEVQPRIEEAFAKVIDMAVFHGTNKPDTWPEGLVSGAIKAGKVRPMTGDLYQDINGEDGVIALVEEKGLPVDAFIGALQLRAKLRGAVDANRQPIFRLAYSNGTAGKALYELNGSEIDFPMNGSFDGKQALLLAGNWNLMRYAIRQDITYKILTEASLTDDSGKVLLNLAQQDCCAIRAVMRLGWALPKPMNMVSGTNYYPFAVLLPTTVHTIDAATFKVTKPVKAAAPQAAHDGGDGYTAGIEWLPAADSFAASTVYTVKVTLTAEDGYMFPATFGAANISGLPKTSEAKVTVERVNGNTVTITAKYTATGA